MSSTELISIVQRYFDAGMLVVPVSGKAPQVKDWPNSKIGSIEEFNRHTSITTTGASVICGSPSQLYCLDVDPRNRGIESLQEFETHHGHLPTTVTVLTGGGGLHFYFRSAMKLKKVQSLLSGVDFQGESSLAVIPGSVHASGAKYEFKPGCSLQDVGIAELPISILQLIQTHGPKLLSGSDGKIHEGGRGDQAFRHAAWLRSQGLCEEEIFTSLRGFNLQKCVPPLSDQELANIAKSCMRYDGKIKNQPLYSLREGSIYRGETRLANFNLRIKEEKIYDFGDARLRTQFVLGGQLYDGTPINDIAVSDTEFYNCDFLKGLGYRAILTVFQSNREHLKAAIQTLSDSVVTTRVYSHTGFREIDGRIMYLHGGGAITALGNDASVQTDLGTNLALYELEQPQSREELRILCREVLELRKLGPSEVTIAGLALVFRAPTASMLALVVMLFIVGPSGSQKTEFTVLLMSFFGRRFRAQNLPLNFESTMNAIEAIANSLKDALAIVDDFNPNSDAKGYQQKQRLLAQIAQKVGNSGASSRHRMNADGSLRTSFQIRSAIGASGEDVGIGFSSKARMFLAALKRDDIKLDMLTKYQESAAKGNFAKVMGAYISWLCGDYDRVKSELPIRFQELRSQAARNDTHQRTPDNVNSLYLGFELFTEFCLAVGAIDGDEKAKLSAEAREALMRLGDSQRLYLNSDDPALYFIECVGAMFVSGTAHLAHAENFEKPPENCENWGWHFDHSAGMLRAKGKRIGWYNPEREEVLLHPASTYAVLTEYISKQSKPINITKEVLWKRLSEKGLIAYGEGEEKNLIKRNIKGEGRLRLLVFPRPSVFNGDMGSDESSST